MHIGYACLTLGLRGAHYKSCTLRNANSNNLKKIIAHNLMVLEQVIDYNQHHGIKLFRITSDLIPFGSSEVNQLPWWDLFEKEFRHIGNKIKDYQMRISLHPGQYTVLNSPFEEVVKRAVNDIIYHHRILKCLEVGPSNKIVLHIGGVYNDKSTAINRFITNFNLLDNEVKKHIVIENDDKAYSIGDVLSISQQIGTPVVYDNLHNFLNPSDDGKTDNEWIEAVKKTWGKEDGNPKIHYAQQDPLKQKGSHSTTIYIKEFMDFYHAIKVQPVDIMLEVKDKNLSAIKCLNTVMDNQEEMVHEWHRYRHLVKVSAPSIYDHIERSMGDLSTMDFYEQIETALAMPVDVNLDISMIQTIWDEIEKVATDKERTTFRLNMAKGKIKTLKRQLWIMINHYHVTSYLDDYYFLLDDGLE